MINVDLINFTPISSFIGGILIGLAVIIFFISTGRLAGVSGIVNNVLTKSLNRTINSLFILGLITGPIIFMFFSKNSIPFKVTSSIPLIIIGGLLVGIGTKIGSGCTSGHGVCGISRFSIRSILATILFMFAGIITVFFLKIIGIN
tara:strand:- start:288 stop:725 length:438 start_codon:yes stop_codon:yes gene_type:complete